MGPQPMMRIFLMSVRFGIPHQLKKLFGQVIRIMRARRRLGMILNAERGKSTVFKAFNGVVVQIDVSNVDFVHVQTLRVDSETVILRGNFHLLALDVQDRMISTVMPESEFECPPPEGETHNLMAQANSKNRLFRNQSADVFDGIVEWLGNAGAF